MSVHTDDVIIANTPLPIDTTGQTINVGNFPASQAVTGPLTDTQLRASPVPISGSVSTTPLAASTSTVTQLTSNGANQVAIASNVNRKKVILFFASGIWFVKLGVTASNTSFTYQVNTSNTTIEVTVWTGEIDVLCTTSGKLLNVTELS